MTHPLIPGLIYPLYLLIRAVIHFLRDIFWKVIQIEQQREQERCAHVLKIIWRYKFDVIIQSNKPEDFVLFHDRYEYPECILKDEVSLYHISKNEAMFVQCPRGCMVWDLRKFTFSREAQFRLAERVIVLPTSVAKQLARSLGKPKDKLIFMGSTSRCGSTLLCRMFQSTGHYISYVEPSVIGDLLPCESHEEDPDIAEYMITTMTLLCKPCLGNPSVEGHVIKIATANTRIIQSLHKLFPSAHYLFVYRNLVPVMKSLARIVPLLPYSHVFSLLSLLSNSWLERFARHHGRLDDLLYLDSNFDSPYRKIFPICLLPITWYFAFIKQGINISAIRYEDLIQDPEGSLKRIFSSCSMNLEYIPKALIPLDQDAQEHSSLSRIRLMNLKIPEFTEADKEQVKKFCECCGIPNLLVERVYPKTVTLSGNVLTNISHR